MTSKNRFVAVLSCLLLLCSLVASVALAQEEEWVGQPAPEFSLQDLDGNRLSLSDLKGKNVVWLNFWGLRCGPCVRELPVLEEIHKAYAARGLVIIGVNADGVDANFIRSQFDNRDDLKAAGVSFPLAPDEEFKAIDRYGLMGAPLNVMIDKQGVIQFRHEGFEMGDEVHYVEVVKKLLDG